MNNYFVFLDYLELRRRIEKRLVRANWLMAHTAVFIFTILAWVIYITNANIQYSSYPGNIHFDFYAPESFFVMGWSILLLVHGLRAYSRSGAGASAREEAVEREIHERLDRDDSYLTANRRHLFRLHGMLEDDIEKRAGLIPVLVGFGAFNAAGWVLWAVTYIFGLTSESSVHYPWVADILLIAAFSFVLMLQAWRRNRHNAKMRRIIPSSIETMSEESEVYDTDYSSGIEEADELVEFYPASSNGKKKRG